MGSGRLARRRTFFIHQHPATDRTLTSRITVHTVKRPSHRHQPAVDADTATIEIGDRPGTDWLLRSPEKSGGFETTL